MCGSVYSSVLIDGSLILELGLRSVPEGCHMTDPICSQVSAPLRPIVVQTLKRQLSPSPLFPAVLRLAPCLVFLAAVYLVSAAALR